MKPTKYPDGWDEARVQRVLAHYEQQTDDEAVAEDEAAYESTTHTAMEVPGIWYLPFASYWPSAAPGSALRL
jgi:hypothetical protein